MSGPPGQAGQLWQSFPLNSSSSKKWNKLYVVDSDGVPLAILKHCCYLPCDIGGYGRPTGVGGKGANLEPLNSAFFHSRKLALSTRKPTGWRRLQGVRNEQTQQQTKEKIMRAFLMCAVLTVAALTVGATSVQAHEYYRGHYYYGPRVVVRPAPIVVGPAPVIVAPAPVVVAPAYAPAPVVVQPAIQPIISLRFGR
jgi:hypothetical protein